MTNEDVKFIIKEIQSIPYYKYKMAELDQTLNRLQDEIKESGEPHSPLGKEGGFSHSFGSNNRILELITEEGDTMKLKKHFLDRLKLAEGYKKDILNNCMDDERFFVIDYLNGVSYSALENNYSISNAYSHMRAIVKRISL